MPISVRQPGSRNATALTFLNTPPLTDNHYWARPRAGGIQSDGTNCQTPLPSHARKQMAQAWAGSRDGDWHLCMCVVFKKSDTFLSRLGASEQ